MKKILAFLVMLNILLYGEAPLKSNSIANGSEADSNLDTALVLSWHNSFCESHMNRKECKMDGGDGKNHLVLHGLWPQPRNNTYCGVSKEIINLDKSKRWAALPDLNLSKEVLELMDTYMPGYESNLHKHEYWKHGTCYSKDPNRYFMDALTLTKYFDSILGEYLRGNIGRRVKTVVFKNFAAKAIDKKIKNRLAVKCRRGVLNEVWISLKGKGTDVKRLIQDAKPIRSNCTQFIVDAPGKFRR